MHRVIDIKDVADLFSSEGYTLLSSSYVGCREGLEYKCPYGHVGETTYFDFSQGYGRCPCQSERKVWEKYNLFVAYPDEVADWDYKMNYPKLPKDFTPQSHQKVWWICDGCDVPHSYKQSIRKHISGHRCPYKRGTYVGYGNDLYSNNKEMCDLEWDWDLNEIWPNEVAQNSRVKVSWKCGKCSVAHSYLKSVRGKVRGRGCPYFAGKKVGYGNSVLDRCPHVAAEWDYSKNKKGPDEYTFGSHKEVWFIHELEDGTIHRWKTVIKNRTLGNTLCPHCVAGGISRISQEWLDSLNIDSLIREHTIYLEGNKFKLDGFDPETNTIYEFLGDYWHGNPEVYNLSDTNPNIGLRYGVLFENAKKRIEIFKRNGYKVVYIWENDFKKK